MKEIVNQSLKQSYSYPEYKQLITDLLTQNKSTGSQQTADLTHYSALNEARMKRLDKTIVVTPEIMNGLQTLRKEYILLVITEGWCGDAAQILPIINKMAALTPSIELRLVLRDDNEELMNLFLTNNAKSIPIVIAVEKETGTVLNSWGPRPNGALELVSNYKKEFGVIDDNLKTNLQLWYLQDKGLSTQSEILQLLID
ncbi:thioredoxin family protein [Flavobacterium sp. K77]|uniref:thioredoxin family protein n=1 Tax=Flavobacterium sp. K77 TaxID=2910676 RepID=UPI001F3EB499|nr:thioredoxin family protein [Flavobacterium sp. K77]MCF6140015.1 thioredoxin family protein [Flavobacterium sp. K77]